LSAENTGLGNGSTGAEWGVVGAAMEMPGAANITGAAVILGLTRWHAVTKKLESRRHERDDGEG
jgi:hypothetical protein